jgi:hypothetical protein
VAPVKLPWPDLHFPPRHDPTPDELAEFARKVQENFDFVASILTKLTNP